MLSIFDAVEAALVPAGRGVHKFKSARYFTSNKGDSGERPCLSRRRHGAACLQALHLGTPSARPGSPAPPWLRRLLEPRRAAPRLSRPIFRRAISLTSATGLRRQAGPNAKQSLTTRRACKSRQPHRNPRRVSAATPRGVRKVHGSFGNPAAFLRYWTRQILVSFRRHPRIPENLAGEA